MLLNLKKGAVLLQVLPKSGSIADQLLAKDIGERVTVFVNEMKEKTNFKDNGNGWFTFESDKDEDREFEFSEAEKHVLQRGVKLLDEQEAVTLDMVDLCQEIQKL